MSDFEVISKEDVLKEDDCLVCGGSGDNDPSGENGSSPACATCNGTGKDSSVSDRIRDEVPALQPDDYVFALDDGQYPELFRVLEMGDPGEWKPVSVLRRRIARLTELRQLLRAAREDVTGTLNTIHAAQDLAKQLELGGQLQAAYDRGLRAGRADLQRTVEETNARLHQYRANGRGGR